MQRFMENRFFKIMLQISTHTMTHYLLLIVFALLSTHYVSNEHILSWMQIGGFRDSVGRPIKTLTCLFLISMTISLPLSLKYEWVNTYLLPFLIILYILGIYI